MLEKIKDTSTPTGLRRAVYRFPIVLYRLGLGGLLGGRFLLLTHTGRKSGLSRHTVLEVVRYDVEEETYIVASGWGARAQWYQNIRANTGVGIQVGRRRCHARATSLEPAAAEREMLDYGHRNPGAAKFVARLMGYRIDGTDADLRALAALVPFIAMRVERTD